MMANKMQTHQLLWKSLLIIYYIIYIIYMTVLWEREEF